MKRSWLLIISSVLLLVLSVVGACAKPAPVTGPGTPQVAPEPTPAPTPAPASAPAPAPTPDYPNHGITTTKVETKPGESTTGGSGAWIEFTMDDLVEKSDTVLIGKVVDIFPSRQVDRPPWLVITDVVIKVERYLYGQHQSAYVAVMVPGGRVEEMVFLVDSHPVFNLEEEAALFLYRLPGPGIPPPDGFEPAEYYMVTGAIQGKLGYREGIMVNLEEDTFTVSEIEQKIASIHGGK